MKKDEMNMETKRRYRSNIVSYIDGINSEHRLKQIHTIAKRLYESEHGKEQVENGSSAGLAGILFYILIGTPIIATESGTIEAIGWNQYGGWRIGIRSFDKKRYYYYAHLRQNYPYRENLKEGDTVTAGDVIGYMGHTGYSTKENVNNIEEVHLHYGIELIFDEARRAEGNEIWIDGYNLVRFLSKNQSAVQKVEGTKEWKRVYQMKN